MKVLGVVFMSVLFLFSIGMDSKEVHIDKGVQELDSLSQSVDSVLQEVEADRITLKLKLEQSLEEINRDLKAVEQLLSVYSGEEKGIDLNKKKAKMEAKKEKLLLAYEGFSKEVGEDWQDLKKKMEVLDE